MTNILLRNDLRFIKEFIDDPDVSDIMVNADGSIFIKKGKKDYVKTLEDSTIVKKAILSIASIQEKIIDEKLPILETVIPYTNFRVEGILPPLSTGPILTIRKPTTKLMRMIDYVHQERLKEQDYINIIKAIENKMNILIAGGTGSGKTTLLNTILYELSFIDESCRLFLVEDTPEVVLKNKDTISVVTTPNNAVEMIRVALRSAPDRIIFGEIRHGDTAIELLKAWNTGHPGGVATIHAIATGYEYVINRLYGLVQEINKDYDKTIIEKSIDCIINIQKYNDKAGGRVEEVILTH